MGGLAFPHGAGDGPPLRDPPPPAPSRAANFPRPAGLCYTGQWANGPGGDEHRLEAPMHDDEFSVTPWRPADSASPAAQPSAARPLRRFRGLRGRLGAAGALALLTLSLCALLLTQLGGVEPLLGLAPLPGRVSPSSETHMPVPTATVDLAHQVFQYPTPLGGTPTPLGPV